MVSTASVVGRSVVDACSVGNGSAPEKIPGLFSHAITAGSPAVRVPPARAVADSAMIRVIAAATARVVGWCGNGGLAGQTMRTIAGSVSGSTSSTF